MGSSGSSTANQIQTIVEERVTNVVQKTIMEKSTAIKQSGQVMQTIENIRFTLPKPGYCPPDQMPSSIIMRQATKGEQEVALTLDMLSASELSDSIRRDLELALSNEVDKEKKGTLAFTDSTNVNQQSHLNVKSIRNIEQAVETVLKTYVNQEQQWGQTVRMITIEQPCGNVEITQETQAKSVATDIAKAVAGAAVAMQDESEVSMEADAKDQQSASDTLVEVADSIMSAISSVFSSMAMIPIMIVLGILGTIILLKVLASRSGPPPNTGPGGTSSVPIDNITGGGSSSIPINNKVSSAMATLMKTKGLFRKK
jgi:hypothetical protein